MGIAGRWVDYHANDLVIDAVSTGLARDTSIRDRIGRLAAEIEVARQLAISPVQISEGGGVPIVEASMSGVWFYSNHLIMLLNILILRVV